MLHIMNEIFQHSELIQKFIVGYHCPNFQEDFKIQCSPHF